MNIPPALSLYMQRINKHIYMLESLSVNTKKGIDSLCGFLFQGLKYIEKTTIV